MSTEFHVGDFVDYEVNDKWFPGYIARRDSRNLFFKYDASKYKCFEEPVSLSDADELSRLRRPTVRRSRANVVYARAPASRELPKRATKPPAAKKVAPKKETVQKPTRKKTSTKRKSSK